MRLSLFPLSKLNALDRRMIYQWDRDKADANFQKHGVVFADSVSIFSEDLALTIEAQLEKSRILNINNTWMDNDGS